MHEIDERLIINRKQNKTGKTGKRPVRQAKDRQYWQKTGKNGRRPVKDQQKTGMTGKTGKTQDQQDKGLYIIEKKYGSSSGSAQHGQSQSE